MIAGIDASNLRAGGGLTHLAGLLESAKPERNGFTGVAVWGARATLQRLPRRTWLRTVQVPLLERGAAARIFWQRNVLPRIAERECDVLLAPGGTAAAVRCASVVMSQNMLPFVREEAARFGWSPSRLRLELLRWSQGASFRRADGLIFVTEFARKGILSELGESRDAAVIPYGVSDDFRMEPRAARARATLAEPFRLLYVSIVNAYKHQWHVCEAVAALRQRGVPVRLEMVGPSAPHSARRLEETLHRLDPSRAFLEYTGECSFAELLRKYREAELFVFASSCESLPNVVLEAMAAGLPICSSDRGPMPEVIGDAGTYFDPERPERIERALERVLSDAELRWQLARRAFARAKAFDWVRSAELTFEFLANIVRARQDGA